MRGLFFATNKRSYVLSILTVMRYVCFTMKIAILITTYNRPDHLIRLLRQIDKQNADCGHEISLIIVADGPQQGYDEVNEYLICAGRETIIETPEHHGKIEYYKVINELYKTARMLHTFEHFDYFIQLPDDVELHRDFFTSAIARYEVIRNYNKVCLNLLNDGRKQPGWVSMDPVAEKYGIIPVIRSGWVDMCFISTCKYFDALNWTIEPIDPEWSGNPQRSSGVGMQISRRLFNLRKDIYMVTPSLVSHDLHESKMHPEHRKQVPLVSFTPKEPVIAGMATMPGRETALQATIRSLINQVDELHIVLNGFKKVPIFLKHRKITAIIDENNTYGDAAKFTILGKSGYLFFTDDDIIYPEDYVQTMIMAIENYDRRAIITSHGRRFINWPVKSYYHDNSVKIRCLGSLDRDSWVHVPGSGVMAFHSTTIGITLSDFKAKNMADIWVGVAAQREETPIVAIKHRQGWIREATGYDVSHSIHARLNGRDQYQTKVMNSIKWKLNTYEHEQSTTVAP